MQSSKAKIATIIVSYLLGIITTLAAIAHMITVGMSHGSATPTVWYEPFVIPGIYLAMTGPTGIGLAIFLYAFVIGTLIYLPIKFICKW